MAENFYPGPFGVTGDVPDRPSPDTDVERVIHHKLIENFAGYAGSHYGTVTKAILCALREAGFRLANPGDDMSEPGRWTLVPWEDDNGDYCTRVAGDPVDRPTEVIEAKPGDVVRRGRP